MSNVQNNAWKISSINDLLEYQKQEYLENIEKYTGDNLIVKGRLKNVDGAKKSKYPIVYNLKLEDNEASIEIEIRKNLLDGYNENNFVELIGLPKLNYFNGNITNRFKAFNIQPCEEVGDIKNIEAELSFTDKLKKFRPKSNSFPHKGNLKIGVIYSSASSVSIENDFYEI